jgi:putative phage-type endonuclease
MSVLTLPLGPPAFDLPVPSGAIEVLPHGAHRDAWLAERRNSIGGSDVSVLTGMQNDRYGSPMALWLDKTGRAEDVDLAATDSAVEWGILQEPIVRQWFARTYRLDVRTAGMYRLPDVAYLHANPDGLIVDDGVVVGGIEIKTTNWRQAEHWDDGQVPDHAELQAQLCMLIIGVNSWYVVGLIDGRNPQVRLVHRDDELISMLIPLAEAFYRDHVDTDQAPALDGSIATSDAVRAWMSAADPDKAVALDDELTERFRDLAWAKAQVASAEADERAADAALRVALGGAEVICDDLSLDPTKRLIYATFPNNGTFSPKRLAAARPDLVEEFTVDKPTLDPKLLKAAHPDVHRAFCARVIRPRKPLTDLLARPTEGDQTT